MVKDIVEAVHQIREYCESFSSCPHGCMFFDSEKFSCRLYEQPHMWSLSDLPNKDK